ncbi:MAG: glycosyltransferase [Bacteroidales bacterium]|nr:glycosyltransferase [Bacteroidales bacterium]MCF8455864.1 glycosyltransferase [Bacteroidales bacterium]
MQKVKEVNVFTTGDSADIRTWSNVPYFFTETLISKGIKVNRIDIYPKPFLTKLYDNSILFLFKKFNTNTTYLLHRTLFHFFYSRWIIRRATRKFKKADANIFLSFSYSSAGYKNKLSVLFSDWTYEHRFAYFEGRKPGFFEKGCIRRENRQIQKSDLLLPLFPGIADFMKERYPDKKVFYLGNVINSVYEADASVIIEKKCQSQSLLFVGSKKYMDAARSLIDSFGMLKPEYPGLSLDIIGIDSADFSDLPEGVMCHGYLDKGDNADRQLYYGLLENARMFINTSAKWGAFSATIEAMYFYIPVIVAPYNEFIKTFGKEIGFGAFCETNTPDLITTKIKEIFNAPNYDSLCMNSHNAVKQYTWSAYIDKVIARIEEELGEC